MSDKILSIISGGLCGSLIGMWSIMVVSKIFRLHLYFEITTASGIHRYTCPISGLLPYAGISGGCVGIVFCLAKEYGHLIFRKQ